MFDRDVDYPTAVASYDDEGVAAAIEWCIQHMQEREGVSDGLCKWLVLRKDDHDCCDY